MNTHTDTPSQVDEQLCGIYLK